MSDMRSPVFSIGCFLLLSLGLLPGSALQQKPLTTTTVTTTDSLFGSDEMLTLSLTGPLRQLQRDRESADPQYFPFNLGCVNTAGQETVIPVELRARGHFRRTRGNCTYPPLLIRFADTGTKLETVFREQHKLKLVLPCAGQEYVIREWLLYRIYNLLTPRSFRTRLVQIKLVEEGTKKEVTPVFGLLLEEESQLAARNQCTSVETKLRPQQTETVSFLRMAVFQYLVGNTDWSVEYLQNIKLLQPQQSGLPITVPYDFDHAGLVEAPYAQPAEELQLSSIRERRYRGYCLSDLSLFQPVLAEFNRIKSDIYKLYSDSKLLDPKYIRSAIRYLDAFYATINNPKSWQQEFAYPCDKNGTGNVIIKGLREE